MYRPKKSENLLYNLFPLLVNMIPANFSSNFDHTITLNNCQKYTTCWSLNRCIKPRHWLSPIEFCYQKPPYASVSNSKIRSYSRIFTHSIPLFTLCIIFPLVFFKLQLSLTFKDFFCEKNATLTETNSVFVFLAIQPDHLTKEEVEEVVGKAIKDSEDLVEAMATLEETALAVSQRRSKENRENSPCDRCSKDLDLRADENLMRMTSATVKNTEQVRRSVTWGETSNVPSNETATCNIKICLKFFFFSQPSDAPFAIPEPFKSTAHGAQKCEVPRAMNENLPEPN